MRQKGINLNHDFYVKKIKKTILKQINNKRSLVDFYKDIVFVTCVRIFCTALFPNNNIKVVIQIDAFLAHQKLKGAYWISSILRQQYWTFLSCSPFSYRSSNFAIAKLSLLIPFLQFLYKFFRLVHGFFSVLLPIQLSLFQLQREQQLSLLSFLKAKAKSKSTHIAIDFKSEKEQ